MKNCTRGTVLSKYLAKISYYPYQTIIRYNWFNFPGSMKGKNAKRGNSKTYSLPVTCVDLFPWALVFWGSFQPFQSQLWLDYLLSSVKHSISRFVIVYLAIQASNGTSQPLSRLIYFAKGSCCSPNLEFASWGRGIISIMMLVTQAR